MKKKLLVMLLAVSMVSSFALTGCGGSDSKESTATESTSNAGEAEKTEEKTEEPAKEETTEEADTAEEADTTEEASVEEESGESDSGEFSLLDVSEDMIEVGVYGMDEEGTELVFSMFKGPDGNEYVSLIGFDNNSDSGDVICGTYEASSEVDEDGDNWTYFNVSDVYTGEDFQLGVAERPETEEVLFFDAEGNVIEGQYLSESETINYMGSAAGLLMQ